MRSKLVLSKFRHALPCFGIICLLQHKIHRSILGTSCNQSSSQKYQYKILPINSLFFFQVAIKPLRITGLQISTNGRSWGSPYLQDLRTRYYRSRCSCTSCYSDFCSIFKIFNPNLTRPPVECRQ